MTEHGIGRIKDDFAGTSRFDRLIHGLWRLVEGKPHGAPDQGDDAFGNHGAVENGTALAFRFDAARHHRGLGGVESADGSTGNGDEKHGPDGKAGRVRSEGDGALRDDLGATEEKSSEHGSRHQDQADGEKRVDAPDEGIDRQDGGGKVVKEDKSGPYGHAHAGHVGQELGRAGGKDDADQDDEDDAEVADDLPGGVAQVLADQFRKAHASVPQGHHTGKIVVDGSAQDTAEGDPEHGDRTVQGAQDGSVHRAEPRNVQKLDQENLPRGQHHEVDPVGRGHGRRQSFVAGAEDPLHQLSVCEIPGDEQGKAE